MSLLLLDFFVLKGSAGDGIAMTTSLNSVHGFFKNG